MWIKGINIFTQVSHPFPECPWKKCNYKGPEPLSSTFLMEFQKQQELLRYAIHESCPNTDTTWTLPPSLLSIGEDLLFLCQKEETDRDRTSHGDIITYTTSGDTSDLVVQFFYFFFNSCFTEYLHLWEKGPVVVP